MVTLNDYVGDINRAAEANAWYAALALALALPDVCGAVEYPNARIGKRYTDWCDKFVSPHDKNLTGADYYVLRCAFLHTGTDEIQKQHGAYADARMRHIYLTRSGSVSFSGVRKLEVSPGSANSGMSGTRGAYALPIGDLCSQIAAGVDTWHRAIAGDAQKLAELAKLFEVYDPRTSPTTGKPT